MFKKSKNILILAPGRLGDMVMTLVAINKMLERYPRANLSIYTSDLGVQLCQDLHYKANVTKLVAIKKKKYHFHWFYILYATFFNFWQVIIDFKHSIVYYLSFAGKRYRFKMAIYPHKIAQISKVLSGKSQDITEVIKDIHAKKITTLYIGKKNRETAHRLITKRPNIISIAPVSNWIAKDWSIVKFKKLIAMILSDNSPFKSWTIAIMGSKTEREKAKKLLSVIPASQRLDVIGNYNILVVAEIIRKSKLFLGGDSGLLHLASGLNVPILGLYGPTDDLQAGPWSEVSQVIRTEKSAAELLKANLDLNEHTMDSISVKKAYAALENLFRIKYNA